MKYFITGITGFTGRNLAESILEKGHRLKALVRHPGRTGLLSHPGLEYVYGDLGNAGAMKELTEGCQGGFHLAANTSVWSADPLAHYRDNVEGTLLLMRAAEMNRVDKVVIVSTAGIYGPSGEGGVKRESSPRPLKYHTAYEISKARMEEELRKTDFTTEWVMVHPTRIYGPGLLNKSNSSTILIDKYIRGKWRILPGDGRYTGNYVLVDDVVKGILLAMQKGRPGENYILGGENLSFRQFFDYAGSVAGKRRFLLPLPGWFMISLSRILEDLAYLIRRPPLISVSFMRRYLQFWGFSSEKAKTELGYHPATFREGVKITINWLRQGNA